MGSAWAVEWPVKGYDLMQAVLPSKLANASKAIRTSVIGVPKRSFGTAVRCLATYGKRVLLS